MRQLRKPNKLTTILYRCVMKSANLNFLEISGPLQACNGTVLLLIYIYIYMFIYLYIYIKYQALISKSNET